LNSDGIELCGDCTIGLRGAILADKSGPLLMASSAEKIPVVALVRMLVPANEVQVPATRQTDWLIAHLPVPEAIVPADSQRSSARIHLRSGETLR
jgi:hypothetical protein